ncbi:hypothetical protein GCM10009710_27310 [Aeromicrobium alkaliterrae]|uniref:Murein biosynthesis integral membrane protein MurJ n=1 Tax=Aeromicrobium alkaliterrae TaxID=302168 RepID=A0ABP4W7P2_9ACTN
MVVAVAVWLLALVVVPLAPAQAADDPNVQVAIDSFSPGRLEPGQPVTIIGTVRNDNEIAWTSAQAYASIARQPDTNRADLVETIAEGTGFSGSRIVDLETIADLGTLEPGESASFSITVPWSELGITAGSGVRTVGVQVLGTAPDGTRSTTPIGRAATVVPVAGQDPPVAIPGTLALTLASPVDLAADGTMTGVDDLVESTSAAGALRRVLDLARSMPVGSASLVVDPQLPDTLSRLTDEDDESPADPDDLALEDSDVERLTTFATDLRSAMSTIPTVLLGYGAPDVTALASTAGGTELTALVSELTAQVVQTQEIPGTPATWVPTGGLSSSVIRLVAGQPLVVDVSDLPDWEERDGSVVTVAGDDAATTALVRRDLSSSLPGTATAATIRQELLAERDFAERDRDEHDDSRADAVVVTPAGWDPGAAWRSADLAGLWNAGLLTPRSLDLTSSPLLPEIPVGAAAPADTAVVDAVRDLQIASSRLSSISTTDAVARDDATLIADLLGLSRRSDPASAIATAQERRAAIEVDLTLPTIEGPPSFLLAGREGQVPVTIDNPTDQAIRVGIRVSSTNPQLQVDDVAPVDVAALSRTTVTIPLDVGQQNTTSLTAQLVTPDGTPIGSVARFNVRSSNTSTIIWIAMGVAGGLLVVAVARRLWRRSRGLGGPRDVAGPGPDAPEDPPFDHDPSAAREVVDPGPPAAEPPPASVPPAVRAVDQVQDASGADVTRASAWMALGTLVSRITGFLRALLLIWAIGTGLNGDIFNNANTVPNALYILVAGGVFNVVLVPQLVRTMRNDEDGGDAYANRVITLGLLVLGFATLVLVLAAPLLVRLVFDSQLFAEGNEGPRSSALLLMYLCVPQVFFYGAFVLVGQILNARGRFGPMMWAPIVNNVVACVALVGYMVMFGREGGSNGFSVGESLVLGIGSTLGIVVQAAVLVPYLRAAGFHYRPRFDFRGVGLGHTLKLGAWTLASIVVNQIAFIVVSRLGTAGNLTGAATGETSSGSAVYNLGYIVSQVPHGVVTVSLATAIMPTLAALAHARDYDRFLSTIAETTRTALFLLVPVAVAIACLGHDLARSISLGAARAGGEAIGNTLVALAPAVVVFSLMFLLIRAFYADEDTRVPFVVQSIVAVTNIAVAVTLTRHVAPEHVAPALGVALSTAYLVGTVCALVWVRRRFGSIVDASLVGFLARLAVTCAGAASAMLLAREALIAIGIDSTRPADAIVRLAVAGVIGAGTYLLGSRLAGMDELRRLGSVVRGRR